MDITSEELKTIELIVNKKGVTEEINKKINYNVALEQSEYEDFSYYIVMKCSDSRLEQQNIILDYYDSINRECTVEKVKALIDVMYIRSTDTSAGDTPDIREACPIDAGRT